MKTVEFILHKTDEYLGNLTCAIVGHDSQTYTYRVRTDDFSKIFVRINGKSYKPYDFLVCNGIYNVCVWQPVDL